jgi:hypothetical protein
MLTTQQSILLFLFGCIPARIGLAVLPTYLNKESLFYYGLVLLLPALGFLYLYFSQSRQVAFEAGGKTWWSELRLIHGLLYLAAAIYALQMKNVASIPLTIDVIFGFTVFLNKHYYNLFSIA